MKNLIFLNKKNIIIFILTLYIFFWDFFLTIGLQFDFRLIILVLSFFIFPKIFEDIKQKNYNFLYLIFLIFFILVLHSWLSDNLLNKKFYLSVFFTLYLFGIAYYFSETILNNKIKIIYIFISLFFISILIHLLIGFSINPEPFSCGAIKNLFSGKNSLNEYIFIIHFISSYSLVFNENSHLAMSSVSVMVFGLYLFTQNNKKISKFGFILISLFIIILFLKSSATLIVGSIISLLCLIFFEYKRLNKYFLFLSLILSLFLTTIFFSDKVCRNKIELNQSNIIKLEKINPFSKSKNLTNLINDIEDLITNKDDEIYFQKRYEIISLKIEELILSNLYSEENIQILRKLKKIISEERSNFLNLEAIKNNLLSNRENKIKEENLKFASLSSDVFFHAMQVTLNSLLTKPFGWGFQGYEFAFNNYNKKMEDSIERKTLMKYNNKDASSNFFKIITEFGVLSAFLFLVILITMINKKITLENKIFLFPFILTQLIRGAGYFNGGFFLILFMLIIVQFKIQKNSKN